MINKFFIRIVTISVSLMAFQLFAENIQEPVELDVATCISLALDNNKDFKLSALEIKSKEIAYNNRSGNFIPTITASSGLEYEDIAVSAFTDPSPSYSDDPLSLSAGLTFSLSLSNKLKYDIRKTHLDYQEEQISYEIAQKQLINEIEKEFYSLITLRSNFTILSKNKNLAEKRFISTQNNYKNGLATNLEVMQAEVNAGSYQPQLSQARSDLDMATRIFLLHLGLDTETEVVLKGDLSMPNFYPKTDVLIFTYAMSQPNIRKQMIAIETLKNNLQSAKASAYGPSLTLSGEWSSSVDSPFESSNWESENWEDSASIGLTVKVPLDGYIKGSTDKTSIGQSEIALEKAEIVLASLIDTSKVEIKNLCQQIATSIEKLEQSSKNKNLAEKSYELTEESYGFGRVERLAVEDAQQAALSAGQEYLSCQYDYMTELIDLTYILNLDSIEKLFELNTKGEKRGEN
jgi:outer membrane protein TolC